MAVPVTNRADATTDWSPDSWLGRQALQQPTWPDDAIYTGVLAELANLPPLVFAGEARELTDRLADVSRG